MKMKKMSNKGFTLIELLAVITIMGILMMVAIPAVSRTIENSRRDTFASVAGEYLTAVRNGVLADEIECFYKASDSDDGKWRVASSLPDGVYYFPICTDQSEEVCGEGVTGDGSDQFTKESIVTSTTDLLESGGKSPFGGADLFGYVYWEKKTTSGAAGEKSKTEYKVKLQDTGLHGLTAEQTTSGLKRSNVSTHIDPGSKMTVEKSGAKAFCKVS